MKATIESYGDTTIVKIQGRIDIGVGDIQLRECLHQVAMPGQKVIILDLEKIKYMDSAGLGELLSVNQYLQSRGIDLCLTHLNAKIYSLLDLTQLITVFNIYDSNEDALQLTHAA